MPKDGQPSRRRFLDILLGGGILGALGAVFYPIVAFLRPPVDRSSTVDSVMAGAVDTFPPDSGTIFKFGSRPGLLIRKPDGTFKAFSGVCTHLNCTVQYRQDLGLIWCACHNGRYNLNGINIAGPPPRPLEEYRVDLKDNQVYVSKMT